MAKQRNSAKPSHSADDSVMYKVLADLLVLLFGWMALQFIHNNYGIMDLYDRWNPFFLYFAIGFAVLSAVGAVLAVCRKVLPRKVSTVLAVACGIIAVCLLLLYRYWFFPLPYMRFFLISVCALYLVHLLYPNDFVLVAALTVACGGVFYLHGRHGSGSTTVIALYVAAAAALLLTLCAAFRAAKQNGRLRFKGFSLQLFSGKSGPIPLYLTCTVWAACIVASLLLGGIFAHYCVYAAAGGLFVAACYYTIRLN